MPALSSKKRNIREYISGYVDGEGCFSISFSKRKKFIVGWETKPSFSVSQNYDRAEVLFLIQKEFGCGFMRRDFSDRTLKYEVRRIDDLIKKVVPHFEKYPLLSSKHKDFLIFKKICLMIKEGKHKNLSGLKEIINFAFKMNANGRRRYTKKEIIDFANTQMKI
jgi:hypothetical protein